MSNMYPGSGSHGAGAYGDDPYGAPPSRGHTRGGPPRGGYQGGFSPTGGDFGLMAHGGLMAPGSPGAPAARPPYGGSGSYPLKKNKFLIKFASNSSKFAFQYLVACCSYANQWTPFISVSVPTSSESNRFWIKSVLLQIASTPYSPHPPQVPYERKTEPHRHKTEAHDFKNIF